MKDWRYKVRLFLTALAVGLGGILPAAGCPGACGACMQCAGLGGAAAVIAALSTARRKRPEEQHELTGKAGHRPEFGGKRNYYCGS